MSGPPTWSPDAPDPPGTAEREQLAAAYRRLGEAGLIAGNGGNVSLRYGEGMLISPTGVSAERITAASVVACGFEEATPRASSEWLLHAGLYRARPEFGAVVHAHADHCTALASLRAELPVFHYDVLAFGGAVRCAPYVTFGTAELAAAAVRAMTERTACLLGNHGMIVAGVTMEVALTAAFALERLARQYLLARAAGTPVLLTAAEVADARRRLTTYQKAGHPHEAQETRG